MTNIDIPAAETDVFDKAASTCLKGIAIIMLLIHHCFMSKGRYKGHTLRFIIPEPYLIYIALFFKICVCLFVFISAYGLTKKLMDGERLGWNGNKAVYMENFLSSRLIRLLGGFIFVFLLADIAALFLGPERFAKVYGTKFPANLEYFVVDMLGLANLLKTKTFLTTYWYYSLAIVLVMLVPVFYLLMRHTGAPAFLALVAVINFNLTFTNTNIWRTFLCIATGMACAYGNTVTKIVQRRCAGGKACKFVIEIAIMLLLMILREGKLKNVLYPLWDALIPIVVTAFCCEFVFPVRPLAAVLTVLGKHSLNIFLVHNFIRMVWFYDWSYSFKIPSLIVVVLLLESLAVSVLIEALKKLVRYNSFLSYLERKAARP